MTLVLISPLMIFFVGLSQFFVGFPYRKHNVKKEFTSYHSIYNWSLECRCHECCTSCFHGHLPHQGQVLMVLSLIWHHSQYHQEWDESLSFSWLSSVRHCKMQVYLFMSWQMVAWISIFLHFCSSRMPTCSFTSMHLVWSINSIHVILWMILLLISLHRISMTPIEQAPFFVFDLQTSPNSFFGSFWHLMVSTDLLLSWVSCQANLEKPCPFKGCGKAPT